MYTAAILTPMSTDLLKWIMRGSLRLEDEGFVVENSQGEPLPHHMTICMGPIEKSDLHGRGILGCKADLTFDTLIYNHTLGVCAVPIIKAICLWTSGNGKYDPLPLKSANTHPHITVCVKPESKPIFSNQMLETPSPTTVITQLDQSYVLKSHILEVGA